MRRSSSARVFTVGQVSKMCEVAPRTVSKWFDRGLLKGVREGDSRTSPRLFFEDDLVAFLRQHSMPLGKFEGPEPPPEPGLLDEAVVLVSDNDTILDQLLPAFQGESFPLLHVRSGFGLGLNIRAHHVLAVIFDFELGFEHGLYTFTSMRRLGHPFAQTPVIAIENGRRIGGDITDRLRLEVFKRPFDAELMVQRVKTLVARTAALAV